MDDWFHRFAWQNQVANNARTYVLSHRGRVLAYHAIASGGIARVDLQGKLAKHRPDPVPIVLLARLAVDRSVQD